MCARAPCLGLRTPHCLTDTRAACEIQTMAGETRITVDESMWPLVVVTYPRHNSADGWDKMFRTYEAMYQRRERFHVVSDGTRTEGVPGPAERRVISEYTKAHEESSRRWVLGSSVAVVNPLVRGALTALAWVAPPVYKLTYFATLAECVDEAFSAFDKAAIPVTATMRGFRSRVASGR
jgi:hypothetical protein